MHCKEGCYWCRDDPSLLFSMCIKKKIRWLSHMKLILFTLFGNCFYPEDIIFVQRFSSVLWRCLLVGQFNIKKRKSQHVLLTSCVLVIQGCIALAIQSNPSKVRLQRVSESILNRLCCRKWGDHAGFWTEPWCTCWSDAEIWFRI